jgi:tubulin gamma
MLDQFDKLRKKNAFLEQYKKERMFENNLDEFDDARFFFISVLCDSAHKFYARATCEELMKEYKACESPDYITYVGVEFIHPLIIFNFSPGCAGWRPTCMIWPIYL